MICAVLQKTPAPMTVEDEDPFKTVDEAASFFADAYRKFIFLRGVIDPFPNELLNPSEFKLARPARSWSREIELSTAEDFARLLANRVNSFLSLLLGLKSWQQILREYPATPRHYLEVEFIWPSLQLGLGEPCALKNQTIFSITKLAILTDSFTLQHEIPRDEEIDLAMLDHWVGHWARYNEIRRKITALNSRAFVADTRNFRNRRAHGLAPSPFGVVPAHLVTKRGRDWRMIWRHEPRLEIDKLIEQLVQQHLVSVALVKELRLFFQARFHGDSDKPAAISSA
jgi:hypothetical protein